MFSKWERTVQRELCTKVIVFMGAGVRSKQYTALAYFFAGDSVTVQQTADFGKP
jgi:hypothetical protein